MSDSKDLAGSGGKSILYSKDLRWRKSSNTKNGGCVQAATDGVSVAVQDSRLPYPEGAALVVSTSDWLAFVEQVKLGQADMDKLSESRRTLGPLAVSLAQDATIELSYANDVDGATVLYSQFKWEIFIRGVQEDGEFTIEWLQEAL